MFEYKNKELRRNQSAEFYLYRELRIRTVTTQKLFKHIFEIDQSLLISKV